MLAEQRELRVLNVSTEHLNLIKTKLSPERRQRDGRNKPTMREGNRQKRSDFDNEERGTKKRGERSGEKRGWGRNNTCELEGDYRRWGRRGEGASGERERERGLCCNCRVVLAPETRRAQRTVPASLDGWPQPGGGTSLPPLPGNHCRGAAAHNLTAVSFFDNFYIQIKTIKRNTRLRDKTQRSVHAFLRADRCPCSSTDNTPDRWSASWT